MRRRPHDLSFAGLFFCTKNSVDFHPTTLNYVRRTSAPSRASAIGLTQPSTSFQTSSSTNTASSLIVQTMNSPTRLPAFLPQAPPSAGSAGGPILPYSPTFLGTFSNPPAREKDSADPVHLPRRSGGMLADLLDQFFAKQDPGVSSDGWSNGLAFVHPT
jgi:hypothetical protein